MNTLSGTDEGRARPSVWPVYVIAAVVLIVNWGFLIMSIVLAWLGVSGVEKLGLAIAPPFSTLFGPRGLFVYEFFWFIVAAAAEFGLIGVLAGVGLTLGRRWGWWCGVLWASMLAECLGWHVLTYLESSGDQRVLGDLTTLIIPGVVLLALLIWTLVTRRRLFFPPKPEGEE